MDSIAWKALVTLLGAYIFLEYFFGIKQAPKEPPLAWTSIPYIGHTLGLMRHKMKYYVKLSASNRLPIYAVSMMGGKIYVANQPELVQAIYRNNKMLSFANLAAEVVSRVSLASKKTTEILLDNMMGEHGDKGYTIEGYKGMHAALAPGSGLDRINQSIIPDVAAAVARLDPGAGVTRISLYQWVRHTITIATSNAVYGPDNPFQESSIYDAFWDFENNLTVLLVNIMPSLIGATGYKGRTKVRKAFEAYFKAGYQAQGSDLVRSRYDVAVRNGVSPVDIAGLETTMSIGVLANTAPAGFWTVWHVFAHPPLLEDLRKELLAIVTISQETDGTLIRHVGLKRIRTSCPLLVSTWHEVLRLIGCGTSARLVREDFLLQDRYLLRKNNVIQMPSQVVHGDPSLWQTPTGASPAAPVDAFDPRRFISAKPQPGAFRPFGGGNTLCPGRHLSATEIQALVVMMVLKYDVVPANGAKWEKPEFFLTSFASAIVSPKVDPVVDITRRKGWEGGKWAFSVPKSTDPQLAATADKP